MGQGNAVSQIQKVSQIADISERDLFKYPVKILQSEMVSFTRGHALLYGAQSQGSKRGRGLYSCAGDWEMRNGEFKCFAIRKVNRCQIRLKPKAATLSW